MEAGGIILIVVGAHLRAEVADRPLAYRLKARMEARLAARGEAGRVIVCSDLWYLNQHDLRMRPTVSIGGPGENALSARLGRLPTVLAIDGLLMVQMDLGDRLACCWGVSEGATEAAVEALEGKYLDAFLEAASEMGE